MMGTLRLRGIIPPMLTPFTREGDVDLGALREEARVLLEAGALGLVVGGSTGEGYTLTPEELHRACRAVVDEVRDRAPVIGGVIANCTRQAVTLGRAAREAGVAALQVTPPHYLFPPDEAGLVEYFGRIGSEVERPVVIYNVIPWAAISLATLLRLEAIPQVAGVKQSGGDIHKLADLIRAARGRMTVLTAVDDLLYPALALGADGVVAAIVTLLPRASADLYEAVRRGDHAAALRLHESLLPVWRAVEGPNLPAAIKFAATLLGRRPGWPRSPLTSPGGEAAERIREAMRAFGGAERAPSAV
ncbi:MAG TPA: dihydrodipicolinate synthase family protein [bacterium]|nr:dihydrodipicolinate synthase family protein [bacterium]